MSIWDNPDLQPPSEDYVRLDVAGDGFDGVVVGVIAQKFDDGTVAPQITFIDDADGEEKAWTAGQIQSKKQLAELRPEAGDRISVRLTQVEKRGNKTLKHIDIKVPTRGTGAPASSGNVHTSGYAQPGAQQAAAAPAPAHNPVPAGIAPEVWAQMTEVQRAQLLTALGAAAPAPAAAQRPAGIDPVVWEQMDEATRAQTAKLLGGIPPF